MQIHDIIQIYYINNTSKVTNVMLLFTKFFSLASI